jgi:hypothetical protein
MKDTDFILAYEQNPLIYDYIYKNGIFYKNDTNKRQYHFPEIDLSSNKLDIVNEEINNNSIIYFCMNEFENLLNILNNHSNKKYVLLADGGDGRAPLGAGVAGFASAASDTDVRGAVSRR